MLDEYILSELENIRKNYIKKIIISILVGVILLMILLFTFWKTLQLSLHDKIWQKPTALVALLAILTFAFTISIPFDLAKEYSEEIKKIIFNLQKKIPEYDEFKIITYKSYSSFFRNFLKKYFGEKNEKNQESIKVIEEDFFQIQYKENIIELAEVKVFKITGSGKYKNEKEIFKGIIIKIPEKIFNPQNIYQNIIVKENENAFILLDSETLHHQNIKKNIKNKIKDLFEINILKKINQQNLEEFLEQIKEILTIVKKYITEVK